MTMPKKANKVNSRLPPQLKETPVEFLVSSAGILVTCLFIITFVTQTFAIPSGSMENTLLIGDHVVVNRIGFAPKSSWISSLLPYRDIQRGEVVVFLSPQTPGLHIVKRIIGIPGDRIHLRNGIVYRNGKRLFEPYILHDRDYPSDAYRDNFPAVPPPEFDPNVWEAWRAALHSHIDGEDIVVPANAYFAMGDHRGISLDSRYWGFVPRRNMIGRPLLVYWSLNATEADYMATSVQDRMRLMAHEFIHVFDETRWRRMFEPIR
jgi:signal peptidase I